MVNKYTLLLLSTVFVVNHTSLNASAKKGGTAAAPTKSLKVVLPQLSGHKAVTDDAGEADSDQSKEAKSSSPSTASSPTPPPVKPSSPSTATANPTPPPTASIVVTEVGSTAVPSAKPSSPKASVAIAASSISSPSTNPALSTVATVVVATAGTPAVSGGGGASATPLKAVSSATSGGGAPDLTAPTSSIAGGGVPEKVIISRKGDKSEREPHLPNGRTKNMISSFAHKTFNPKAYQLLGELKPIPDHQRFDSNNQDADAQFISDAAIEARNCSEHDLIIQTVPLLVKHAKWAHPPLVNETARHAYRNSMRELKKRHIANAITVYNAGIKEAQLAYEKAMIDLTARVKAEYDRAQQAHSTLLTTHDLGGDSDVDETDETYSPLTSLAGVQSPALRGVKEGELITSKPLKIQKKIKIDKSKLTAATTPASTGSAATAAAVTTK